MDHQHPLEKITAHPRLFLGYVSRGKYLAHARMLRVFSRETWDEFLYDDKQ
jgi:hypothetical protein